MSDLDDDEDRKRATILHSRHSAHLITTAQDLAKNDITREQKIGM